MIRIAPFFANSLYNILAWKERKSVKIFDKLRELGYHKLQIQKLEF